MTSSLRKTIGMVPVSLSNTFWKAKVEATIPGTVAVEITMSDLILRVISSHNRDKVVDYINSENLLLFMT